MNHNRRKFLKAATLAGVAAGTGIFKVPGVLAERSPNSKLRTVVIGATNQGLVSCVPAAVTEQLVALVDVDDKNMAKCMKWIGENCPDLDRSNIKTFFDYRRMFDAMHNDIDAVFIATPDHHHAVAAMIAMSLGKAVYLEKPMAHSIEEVRRLMAAEQKYKVATQLGNQGHSAEGIRRLCEYIWTGEIGNVTGTYSWCALLVAAASAGGRRRFPCPTICIGTSGSARRTSATITKTCTPGHGGVGGSLATHRSAIGAATTSTVLTWP